MSDFLVFFKLGLFHVLDINAYDHILFLIVLTAPYLIKDWKRLLILISLFTLGHTLSLFLAVFNVITVKSSFIEFLIPITILITGVYNLFTAGKSSKSGNISFIGSITVFFGIIHGLGFSNYIKSLLFGEAIDKMGPLLKFALGIETAQLIVVIGVLIVSFAFQTVLKFNKRDFTLMLSSFVIGVVVPMIINNDIWR
jgi:hypothetical protein